MKYKMSPGIKVFGNKNGMYWRGITATTRPVCGHHHSAGKGSVGSSQGVVALMPLHLGTGWPLVGTGWNSNWGEVEGLPGAVTAPGK